MARNKIVFLIKKVLRVIKIVYLNNNLKTLTTRNTLNGKNGGGNVMA
jgi:hypothetical protein